MFVKVEITKQTVKNIPFWLAWLFNLYLGYTLVAESFIEHEPKAAYLFIGYTLISSLLGVIFWKWRRKKPEKSAEIFSVTKS